MEKILKKNDEIVVTIERLGDSGEGVAVYNGIVVFVPYAKIGDQVKVHIINDKKTFLIAKIIEKLSSATEEIVPPCPYFYKCGGCDLQHLSNDEQLQFKKNVVKNTLKKFGKIDVDVLDVVASDKWFRYRNKFAFPVQDVNGEIKIGMFKKHSHEIIEIDDCLLQSEKTKIILRLFREYMQENNISAYNEKINKGVIKHIVVREKSDSFILTVVVTQEKFNNFDPLIKKLKTQFGSFGVVKNVNKFNNNVIFGNFDEKVYGLENLEHEDFGVQYEINNRSFLQVNDYIKNVIYQKIIDTIGTNKTIIDAYSGAGLLSAILAKHSENVIGVEIEKEATKNADDLKKKNNLYNLINKNGDCAAIIPELAKEFKGDFAIVVDPPRKGLDDKVVQSFLEAEPKKIVYLSCNPATLARDLEKLCQKYDVEFVQPYDMFPQTANVETLVSLKLKTQKPQKNKQNKDKKPQKLSKTSRYFDFYDDVKASCHKIVDW